MQEVFGYIYFTRVCCLSEQCEKSKKEKQAESIKSYLSVRIEAKADWIY